MEESRLNAKNGNPAAPEQKAGIVAGVKAEGCQQTESGERVAALFRSLSERMKAAGADKDTVCKTTAAIAGMAEKAEKPDYFVLHLLRKIVPKKLNVRNIGTLQEDVRLFGLLLGKYMREHGLEMLPEKSTHATIEQLGEDLPHRSHAKTCMLRDVVGNATVFMSNDENVGNYWKVHHYEE